MKDLRLTRLILALSKTDIQLLKQHLKINNNKVYLVLFTAFEQLKNTELTRDEIYLRVYKKKWTAKFDPAFRTDLSRLADFIEDILIQQRLIQRIKNDNRFYEEEKLFLYNELMLDKESKQQYQLIIDNESILTEIKNLKELNNQISNDALNLTKALKGQNKIQGDWGEMILESILNQSGLRRDIEYKVQNSFRTSEGNLVRPDVIVHLPTNKDIIIDSKLSLNSYVDYFNSEDEIEKKESISRLINSIKNHIKDLSSKKYENIDSLRSLDFVLMFIPIEGAFSIALSQNSNIFEMALKSNIVIVSPTTLYSSLKVIENLWQDNRQSENAKEISKQAADLYDKFVGFLNDFEDIGKSIDKSKESYDKAINKLSSGRGNLISRSQKFLELGVKPTKEISNKYIKDEE
ncbi:MAG TPA: DNA recombination protein RmuC [Aliarcobacter cryaerophilus]|nr:DNA recombination protein RmuC [Aliarcobacter cryaerophilus]